MNSDPAISVQFRLATYNAYKMFDELDDPHKNDGPPKSQVSMEAVAAVLRDSEADVVSLQEIENVEVLEELRERHDLDERFPYTLLLEGNDRKGIDVAIMSRYPIVCHTTHKDAVVENYKGKPQYFRRDLLEADVLLPNGQTLRVFTTHFIAQRDEWCDARRLEEAKTAQRIAVRSTQEKPVDYCVVMGDFNDVEGSEVLAVFDQQFHNTSMGLPPSWGHLRRSDFAPQRLDHIVVGEALQQRLRGQGVFAHPKAALASDHALVYADFLLAA